MKKHTLFAIILGTLTGLAAYILSPVITGWEWIAVIILFNIAGNLIYKLKTTQDYIHLQKNKKPQIFINNIKIGDAVDDIIYNE